MAIPAQWADDILRFWLDETAPEQWFKKDDAFDDVLRRRFLTVHEELCRVANDVCLADASTALAAVIAFDQFPRNMFRGTPRAFATDARALALAEAAVAKGFDTHLTKDGKLFLYLPFLHAEDPAAQRRGVSLTEALGNPEHTRFAVAHKEIIDRFGRFPHRNAVLGRSSTPEELAFLQTPGSSF